MEGVNIINNENGFYYIHCELERNLILSTISPGRFTRHTVMSVD
jgi:hypothetical protein